MKTKIYVLKNEFDEIRYVGKTHVELLSRLRNHIWCAKRGQNTHRSRWIRSMLANSRVPIIQLVNEVDGNGSTEERALIAFYRSLGFNLTNGTDGGEGLVNPTPETRRKMREAKLGKPLTAEHRAKIALAITGRRHSDKTKRAIGAAHKGRALSSAHKEKLRVIGLTRVTSLETKSKISNSLRGRVHSSETKKKIGDSQRGRHLSVAQREKIKASWVIRRARMGLT